jgi:glycosyltransferase involved in cell wall biosynthesis
MKTGIILPCYNIEQKINLSNILTVLRFNASLHFCFVNNGSSDNTLRILEYLNRESEIEMSVLDIKKKKNKASVIRAGERFLKSNKDFDDLQSVCLDFSLKLDALVKFLDNEIIQKQKFNKNNFKFKKSLKNK